jgi:hypothetical protein
MLTCWICGSEEPHTNCICIDVSAHDLAFRTCQGRAPYCGEMLGLSIVAIHHADDGVEFGNREISDMVRRKTRFCEW